MTVDGLVELIAGPVIAFSTFSPLCTTTTTKGMSSGISLSVPVFDSSQSTRDRAASARKLLKEATDTEGHTDFDSLRRVPVLDQILFFGPKKT